MSEEQQSFEFGKRRFIESPRPRTPAARRADPVTSHEAARQVTASGARDGQARDTLIALRANPGATTAELSVRTGIDRHAVARRMPELEKLGLVRRGEPKKCGATKRRALAWYPVRKAGSGGE